MEKCWFVFRQTHYPAPEYTQPGMAFGAAEGPIRLGHFIPSPRAIDNVINSEDITPFPRDMHIWPTTTVDFRFTNKARHDIETSAKASAPIASVPDMTINAEVGMIFKRIMGDTWDIDRLDTQIVQPTMTYLEQCRKSSQVAAWVEKHRFLGAWKVYMVSGLMIARGARHERMKKSEAGQHAGGSADLPGVVKAETKAKHSDEKEVESSGQYVNDFVWAIRLTEVSKSLFRSNLSQQTVKKGAVFAPGSDKIDIRAVLAEEGLKMDDVHTLEVVRRNLKEDEQQFLVTMDGY